MAQGLPWGARSRRPPWPAPLQLVSVRPRALQIVTGYGAAVATLSSIRTCSGVCSDQERGRSCQGSAVEPAAVVDGDRDRRLVQAAPSADGKGDRTGGDLADIPRHP